MASTESWRVSNAPVASTSRLSNTTPKSNSYDNEGPPYRDSLASAGDEQAARSATYGRGSAARGERDIRQRLGKLRRVRAEPLPADRVQLAGRLSAIEKRVHPSIELALALAHGYAGPLVVDHELLLVIVSRSGLVEHLQRV